MSDLQWLVSFAPRSMAWINGAEQALYPVDVPLSALDFVRIGKRPIPHLGKRLSAEERMRLVRSYPRPFDPIEVMIRGAEVTVPDGQHRLTVARERGDDSIPVIFIFARPHPNTTSRNCGGNPAAIYCVEQGGELLPYETARGQDSMCRLPDGRTKGQWDLFRREGRKQNPFLAKPVKFHGHPAGGTHQLPGFHTASMRDQALPYAHQKGGAMDADRNIDEDCDECDDGTCPACVSRWRIADYPVVVAVDMSGLEAEHDIDARHVLGNLKDAARDALESDNPVNYFRCDGCQGSEEPHSVEVALFQSVATHEDDPSNAFASYLEDLPEDQALDAIRAVAAGGRKAAQIVMDVIGQFRYLKDVSADRIVEIYYVKPFWDSILDVQGREEDEELAEALEVAGWEVLDVDDIHNFNINASFRRVWGREPPPDARIEWHGTGYRNLLLAAPELADQLPVPPLPYQAS